jgi:hypothetical protein
VARLAELIVPADDVSHSVVDAGAPEFIDLLASHNQKVADRAAKQHFSHVCITRVY